METRDWLSRLLELLPVTGALDFRCMLGAPWRIDFPAFPPGEIAYHVVLAGTAVLEDPEGGCQQEMIAGDIVLFPHGSAHVMRDESGTGPAPGRYRRTLSVT